MSQKLRSLRLTNLDIVGIWLTYKFEGDSQLHSIYLEELPKFALQLEMGFYGVTNSITRHNANILKRAYAIYVKEIEYPERLSSSVIVNPLARNHEMHLPLD